ncbi:MAG: glycoside hydrolase family 28 protein [Bacillota bacterium]
MSAADPLNTQADWNLASQILQAIERPSIPDRTYVVTDYGAVGDGKTDARPAILETIRKASAGGGGRVVLPAGLWYSKGPIHLESYVDLHLAEGATLLFSPDPGDYLPVVRSRWEGTELMTYSPLIYANGVHDVAISGRGTIDGNRESGFHAWHKLQGEDQQRIRVLGARGVPVEQRVFAEGTYLRPSMIQFFNCQRVLLTEYLVENSPFWVNHLIFCDHVSIRGVRIDSMWPNNDGVDLDSCTYAVVENCLFRTGDDGVVIKSGRDYDGRRAARPSEYIVVHHNDMGGEDGIALGSEMSGSIRHVFFTDNILRKGSAAVRFKGSPERGGVVEHIRVRNMTVESFERLIWFQLNYPGDLGGYYPAVYKDLVFEDMVVESTGKVLEVHAPKGYPLQGLRLRNIQIRQVTDPNPVILENVEGLVLENVQIGDQRIDGVLNWK